MSRATGLINALLPVGPSFLEVVAPTRSGTAAGRYLERRGGDGGYMVIVDCDDIERRRRHVETIGVRVANPLRYEDYTGLQLHPRDTGGAMLELNHTEGGERLDGPYHPAGPHWQDFIRRDTTRALLAAELQSADPAALAARWAGDPGARSRARRRRRARNRVRSRRSALRRRNRRPRRRPCRPRPRGGRSRADPCRCAPARLQPSRAIGSRSAARVCA